HPMRLDGLDQRRQVAHILAHKGKAAAELHRQKILARFRVEEYHRLATRERRARKRRADQAGAGTQGRHSALPAAWKAVGSALHTRGRDAIPRNASGSAARILFATHPRQTVWAAHANVPAWTCLWQTCRAVDFTPFPVERARTVRWPCVHLRPFASSV